MELFAFNILNDLPETIQALFFNEQVEKLITTVFSLANIKAEQQSELNQEIINVLIGKHDLRTFENMLVTTFKLSDSLAKTTMDFLNEKLFKNIANDLIKAQNIYKQLSSDKVEFPLNNKNEINVDGNDPSKILSYIKELANSLKQNESKIDKTETTDKFATTTVKECGEKKEEIKNIKPVIEQTNKEEKTIEPLKQPEPEKKESVLLQAMRHNELGSDSKLSEYYKSLKDSLDNKIEEKENVFQPPFRSVKSRGALVESSFDTQNSPESPFANSVFDNESKETKEENIVDKQPIKYNSINYVKKGGEEQNIPKKEEKFIDLGDF